MINYFLGKVTYIAKTFIIFETNYAGYKINIIKNEHFELNKYIKIYIHKIIRLDNKNNLCEEMYGFENLMQKNIFSDLLSINGIGVVTACNILANNDAVELCKLIANKNMTMLCQLKGISERNALLICSDLSHKYQKNYQLSENNNIANNDLIYALKQLGYNKEEITYALNNCDQNLPLNELINMSIKLIAQNVNG